MNNKNLLEVYHFDNKIRLGDKKDGGYVICELDGDYDCYISCGVSNEASFDRDFFKKYKNLTKENSFAFDGTIRDYPYRYTKNITFYKKNISDINDDKHSNLDSLISKYERIFLSIDIEGGEYPWLLSLSESKLQKFKQICIEFHGLCNNKWGSSYSNKIKCLRKLNNTHYIFHAHGNNNGGIKNGIPDVLELTYVNKNYVPNIPLKNTIPLPINGLDFSNKAKKSDYILAEYPFTNRTFDRISIGGSKTNTKTVKLSKVYSPDTELFFIHNFKDTFSYVFDSDKLIIKRTDQVTGWGQNLVGYL